MSRKLILASTMTMVLAGTDASALGLGGLDTQSALNQPFAGEIELLDIDPDELDAVKAKIASEEAFAKAGLDRYYYLTRLRFEPEISPRGRPVIRVSSRDPIREPYLDLLIEVVWPTGQLIKEYTVLLDPPVLASRRAPAVRTPVAAGAARPDAGTGGVAASRSAHGPSPGEGFPLSIGPVRQGANLWALARAHRPAGASINQTAMALYRNNQGAFVRGNINRLRVGETLIIPTRDELFALDTSAADREFQTALRGGAVHRAPITRIPPETHSSRLRIAGTTPTTSVVSSREGVPTGPAPAPAQAATRTPSAADSPAMQRELMLALETSESARQETEELRGRIRELEGQLADIQGLLQLRNAELARIQEAQGVPGVLAEGPTETPLVTPVSPDTVADPTLDTEPVEVAMEEPQTESFPPTESPGAEALETDSPAAGAAAEVAESPGAEAPLDEAAPSETPRELVPVPTPAPSEPAQVVVEPSELGSADPQPEEPTGAAGPTEGLEKAPEGSATTWESLALPLAGLGGAGLLGLVLAFWATGRRRRREQEKDLELDQADFAPAAAATEEPRDSIQRLGETRPSSVATKGESESLSGAESTQEKSEEGGFDTPLSMSSLSHFDAETDEADVVSEADIYIAYGRHSEAQELLLKEMKRSPDRLDIKFKLAEAYAGTQDVAALEQSMETIRSAGGDTEEPVQWKRLQELLDRIRAAGGGKSGAGLLPLDELMDSAGEGGSGGVLSDSAEVDAGDSFSLDISDIQRPSSDFAPEPKPAQPQGPAIAGLDATLAPDLPKLHSQEVDLEEELALPPTAGADDTLGDSFGEALTVPCDDMAGRGKKDEDAVANLAANTPAGDSELVLTLEEPQAEDAMDDLDSMFDSTLVDEPTLARNEVTGARPSGSDAHPIEGGAREQAGDTRLPPEQESVPTDLLSSQWQMDSGIWDETATKLDLARAYIEMDDSAAAREILEEVIAEGRDEQRDEARSLLEKLA